MEQSTNYLPHIIVGLAPLMEEDTGYLLHIIVGIVALIVGWAIGFFDSNLRANKKIKQAETSAEIAIKEAEERTAEAQTRLSAVSDTPIIADDPGMLRVKNNNGRLSLDMDGEAVNTSLSPLQRKRLIEILNLVRPWLDGKPAPVIAPAPPSQDLLNRLDSVSASHPIAAPPSPQGTQAKPSVTSSQKKSANKDEKTGTAPTSMVGQINAILQLRIANTPLATQGVTMIESPSGGVSVYVGMNKYDGIDEVPNEEVKTVIRAAIAEWEKKYTPGL